MCRFPTEARRGDRVRDVMAEQVLAALQHHEVDAGEYKWYIDILRLKQLNTMGWGIGAAEIALSALSKRVSLDPRLLWHQHTLANLSLL